MKLIFAVVQEKDADACADALTAAGFVSTRFSTQGGFLDNRNCTLMIGVEDQQIDQLLDILRSRAQRRVEMVEASARLGGGLTPIIAPPLDVEVGGATVFVVPLERVEKL